MKTTLRILNEEYHIQFDNLVEFLQEQEHKHSTAYLVSCGEYKEEVAANQKRIGLEDEVVTIYDLTMPFVERELLSIITDKQWNARVGIFKILTPEDL